MDLSTAESLSGVLTWAAASTRGARARNQDRYGAGAGPCLVLADGMGGHLAGERAAEQAVKAFARAAVDDDLATLARSVSRELLELGSTRPELAGLGTTVVVARLEGRSLHHLHCGDSRLYLGRAGELRLLTEPHELLATLAREGVVRDEEVQDSPLRGRLTSYLGMADPALGEGRITLEEGDRILMVSDGALEGGIDQLAAAVLRSTPEEAAWAAVGDRPTRDNATALVAAYSAGRSDVRRADKAP